MLFDAIISIFPSRASTRIYYLMRYVFPVFFLYFLMQYASLSDTFDFLYAMSVVFLGVVATVVSASKVLLGLSVAFYNTTIYMLIVSVFVCIVD